jgi:type VI secretion system FHA domain protein
LTPLLPIDARSGSAVLRTLAGALGYTAIRRTRVILTLEIVESSVEMPRNVRHVFGEEGGSIGRAPNNSWTLAHNEISKQHALIVYRNGVFYIQDTSRNGVAVNSPDNRLVKNRAYPLKPGDRIFIEPYQMEVWIEAGARQSPLDPFGADDPFAPQRDLAALPNIGPIPAAPPVHDEVDPLKFFEPVASSRPSRKPEPMVPPVEELLNAHYQPPVVLPPSPPPRAPNTDSGIIPRDYDPLRPDDSSPPVAAAPVLPPSPPLPMPTSAPVRPRPGDASERRKSKDATSGESTVRQAVPIEPTPVLPEAPRNAPSEPPRPARSARPPAGVDAEGGANLAQILEGAGVADAVVTPELSRDLGRIIRIVVDGLMDILKSRQRIKEEFRMHQTMFRPADNNPLKFSANVEDALHNLLVKRNAAYLGPVEAFADAFDDLRDHQLAMLAGMRVAFDAMLASFDADALQEDFDAQLSKHALPLVPNKLRYWDLYRERRQAIAKDPEAAFDRLFGEEFRRAYEEQFRQLKAARRPRGSQGADGS